MVLQTTLVLVRHAHSTYTSDELGRPLSSKGFSDAVQMSELLQKESIDVVISSPYKRAIQTVEGIAEFFDLDVVIVDGFKERTLSGQPVEDFDVAIRAVWENPAFSWNGGESNLIAQQRGVEATLNVLDLYEGKYIVVGTHGNIMALIMNYFDEHYDFRFWNTLGMPDAYKLTFENKKLLEVNRLWTEI
ncbi:histidine phosphatase family protein [Sporosarcina gallistercoris]|uniref:Histidine phosphatase family protein n=1 Tax=Sporosarcina gallistercoris TaxID=2762245 RepID=A0ABR8PEW3_9BACL|nr:histidine phosphatase family protein [Sporosarcina gallistercoris]MBD7906716.1 histidine phosphatase family protein [Sporosarcina gallistercoris]